MDYFGKDDLSIAQAIEDFLSDAGKPGITGWYENDLRRAK